MTQITHLKFDESGLVTVVAQDRLTGEIRMVAHANQHAVEQTLATKEAHFYSRSRQKLWKKGETSGFTLKVHEVWADCDGDALIYLVEPLGPTCHTGQESCFFQRLDQPATAERAMPVVLKLWHILQIRRGSEAPKSYTKTLLLGGVGKIGEKITEEAGEYVQALNREDANRVVSEAVDVVYHSLVGLLARDVELTVFLAEVARRFTQSGIDEKASRNTKT